MADLHSSGIVWGCDFRPENICWFPKERRLKATCLESAVQLTENRAGLDETFSADEHVTLLSSFKITPFMAPETAAASVRRPDGAASKPWYQRPVISDDYWTLGLMLLLIEQEGRQNVRLFGDAATNSDEVVVGRLGNREWVKSAVSEAVAAVTDSRMRQLLMNLLDLRPERREAIRTTPRALLDSNFFHQPEQRVSPPRRQSTARELTPEGLNRRTDVQNYSDMVSVREPVAGRQRKEEEKRTSAYPASPRAPREEPELEGPASTLSLPADVHLHSFTKGPPTSDRAKAAQYESGELRGPEPLPYDHRPPVRDVERYFPRAVAVEERGSSQPHAEWNRAPSRVTSEHQVDANGEGVPRGHSLGGSALGFIPVSSKLSRDGGWRRIFVFLLIGGVLFSLVVGSVYLVRSASGDDKSIRTESNPMPNGSVFEIVASESTGAAVDSYFLLKVKFFY